MSRSRRTAPAGALVAALCGVAALGSPFATAVDDTKPVPCTGLFVTDPAGDQAELPVPAASDRTDIVGVFFKHEPAKGAEATTVNVIVKNLDLAVPDGYTATNWNVVYTTSDGTVRFVRAVLDFSGSLVFEYGDFVDLELTGSFFRMGETPGKVFEGPEGIIQLVLPPDRGAVGAGAKLDGVYAAALVGRALPNAFPTPTRGLSNTLDSAPNGEDDPPKSTTVTPCPAGAPAAVPPSPTAAPPGSPPPGSPPPSSPPPSSQPPSTTTTTGGPALPVRLVSRTLRARKVKRSAAIKLRSSEPVTRLAAQLRRGNAVFGTGRLARLNGRGTLKLKVRKRLRKGRYLLDIAGDASGARRLTTLRLRVR